MSKKLVIESLAHGVASIVGSIAHYKGRSYLAWHFYAITTIPFIIYLVGRIYHWLAAKF